MNLSLLPKDLTHFGIHCLNHLATYFARSYTRVHGDFLNNLNLIEISIELK